MVDFRRLEDVDTAQKRVLVRVDFNVPLDGDGRISDDTRLRAAIPTIKALQASGARTILLSHFGRPDGKFDPAASLATLATPLSKLLETPVLFAPDCIGPQTRAIVDTLAQGGVLLLENTRFHPGETHTKDGQKGYDPAFAQALADLGDIFIHDAFSVAHRAQASTTGVGLALPAYAGLAMERELDHLSMALDVPKHPVMGLVGGAKVSTKIDLLNNLTTKLDYLAIGGGMANTFLAALGHEVGASLCEHGLKNTALEILDNAKIANCEILLPVDVVVATDFKAHAPHRVCALDELKDGEMILDAGPKTVTRLLDAIDRCQTLIWNGPLGAFELPPFDTATIEVARYASRRVKAHGLIAVAGGGDTVAALNHARAADGFSFISTAGGAFLQWTEGKSLPGIEILKKSD